MLIIVAIIVGVAILLSAVLRALVERHFVTLGVFVVLWGILSMLDYHLGLNFGWFITIAVAAGFVIFEAIRRKLDMVNLKM